MTTRYPGASDLAIRCHRYIPELSSLTGERFMIGIDPGGSSGLAIVMLEPATFPLRLVGAWLIHPGRAAETDVLSILDGAIHKGSTWAAAIERPFNPRGGGRGIGQAPSYAYRYWQVMLVKFARMRRAKAGGRYLTPTIIKPIHQQWRGPLGLPTKGDREQIKAAAIGRAQQIYDIDAPSDVAEAILIAHWAATELRSPFSKLLSGKQKWRWVP